MFKGKVCIFTSATTHLIADVDGFYPANSSYESLVPIRMMDSRFPGSPTADEDYKGFGPLPAGSIIDLKVAERGGVPTGAETAVLNVTVTRAQGSGYITVFPCDSPQPNSSNLNFVAGSTIANLVVTKLDFEGWVCIFTSAPTDLIVDVDGYYAA